tara:strand:+ start:1958 stop:9550 length:7593 start_codon:yes stop_codon:yes gene_type:complete
MATAAKTEGAPNAGLFAELDAIDAARAAGKFAGLDAIDAAAPPADDSDTQWMRDEAEDPIPQGQEFAPLPGEGPAPVLPQVAAPWFSRQTDRVMARVVRDSGVQPAAPRDVTLPPRGGQGGQAPRYTGLLPPVSEDLGAQVVSPGQRGLHPTGRGAALYDMPGTEFTSGYGDVVTQREKPDLPEGVEGAFADDLPQWPSDVAAQEALDERSAMEKGSDVLLDIGAEAGVQAFKWADRITIGNLGRAWGILKTPFTEAYDAYSAVNAVEGQEYMGRMMKDMEETLNDQHLLDRMSHDQVIGMRRMVKAQRERREEMHGYKSKIIDTMYHMEDILKSRVGANLWESLYMAPINQVKDARDIALGMGHLVFMDILGLGGESAAAARTWEEGRGAGLMANVVNYSSVVAGDGVGSGEDITAGAIGAAMALSATIAPRLVHEYYEDYGEESGSTRRRRPDGGLSYDMVTQKSGPGAYDPSDTTELWRNPLGILPLDALEGAPFTTAMFVISPFKKGIARAKGRIQRGTAYYKQTSNHYMKKFGEGAPEYVAWKKRNPTKPGERPPSMPASVEKAVMDRGRASSEYKAWRRGEGKVPEDLSRAYSAAQRIKMAGVKAILESPMFQDALNAGIDLAHDGFGRPKAWAKRKIAAGARRVPGGEAIARGAGKVRDATRTQSQRASAVLREWWADALEQMDESSAVLSNAVIRGPLEVNAAALGLTRSLSESTRLGEVWQDVGQHSPPPRPPPLPAVPQPPPLPPRLRDRSARPVVPLTQAELVKRGEGASAGRKQAAAEADRAFFEEADSVAAAIDKAEFANRGQKEAVFDQQAKPLFDKKFGPKADGEYVAWLDSRKKYPLMDELLKEEAGGERGNFGRKDGIWMGFQRAFGEAAADILTPIYEAGELHKFLPERVVAAAMGRKPGQKTRMGAKSGETFEMTPYAPGADLSGIKPHKPGPLPAFQPRERGMQRKSTGDPVYDKSLQAVEDAGHASIEVIEAALGTTGDVRAAAILKRMKDEGLVDEAGAVIPFAFREMYSGGFGDKVQSMQAIEPGVSLGRATIKEVAPDFSNLQELAYEGEIGKSYGAKEGKLKARRKETGLADLDTKRQSRTSGDLPPMPRSRVVEAQGMRAWYDEAEVRWDDTARAHYEAEFKKSSPEGTPLARDRFLDQKKKEFLEEYREGGPEKFGEGVLYDDLLGAEARWGLSKKHHAAELKEALGRDPTKKEMSKRRKDFLASALDGGGAAYTKKDLSRAAMKRRREAFGKTETPSGHLPHGRVVTSKKAPVYAEPPSATPKQSSRAAEYMEPKAAEGRVVVPHERAPRPAESYVPQPRRRNHMSGIFEHEYDAFKVFVEREHQMGLAEAKRHFGKGNIKLGEQRLAMQWFERKTQSRVLAALNAKLHNFSPSENAYWGSQYLVHLKGGNNIKKAEYLAYRDVLRGRGLEVTSDVRSLGLMVDQIETWADEGVWQAEVEAAGGRRAFEAGTDAGVISHTDPRWTRQAKVTNATEAEVFAHLDRNLNEQHPVSRSRPVEGDDFRMPPPDLVTGIIGHSGENLTVARRGAGAGELSAAIRAIEDGTGFRFTHAPVNEGFARVGQVDGPPMRGFQQDLPLFGPKHKFSREQAARIDEASSAIGIDPQYFKDGFAEALNWKAYPYFLKSSVAQGRIKRSFNNEINAFNKRMKDVGKKGISHAERSRMIGSLNGKVKSMSVGWGTSAIVKDSSGRFSYNVMDFARKAMESDVPFMREVLADTVLSTGFKMADDLASAKIKHVATREYARAPVTSTEVTNAVLDAYTSGDRSPPALLRRSPIKAKESLRRRLEGPEREYISKTDLRQAIRALDRYEVLPKEVMEYLSFDPEGGPVYAPRAFSRAVGIEIKTRDMIKTNNLMDRAVRSTKRGLVPLNVGTLIRNTMSDWNLLSVHTGNPMVFMDVIKAGKELHRFQSGKMKRADNPAMFEVFEALERTGLVDATFLEANFGHGRFKGVLSVVADVAEDRGAGYSAWRISQLEKAFEKTVAEPHLKAFRASTNAFKQYKGMEAFGDIAGAALKHRAGELFQLEVRPNRWASFEVLPGHQYKHVSSGKTLTRQQWMDTIARTAKVTSDKLFFDYTDAGAWLKTLRAQPGVRWLMGSLFAMYYAKSATIPGVARGLMRNVRNPNPAMRPGNAAVKADFAMRAADTDVRVSTITAGARAAMVGGSERDKLLKAAGWRRNRVPMMAFKRSLDGASLNAYNFDNLDFHESSDTVARAISAGVLYTGEALGLLPDDNGDIATIYNLGTDGKGLTEKQRLNYGTDGMTAAEKRYAMGLRRMKMRELKGEGFRLKDVAEMAFLNGGPLLEAITRYEQAEMSDRPIDVEQLLFQYGTSMAVGTLAKAGNVVIGLADPSSKFSTLRYTLKDPEKVARNKSSGFIEHFMRWAIKTTLVRTYQRVDLDPDSAASKRRKAAATAGLNASLVKPYEDAAKVYTGLLVMVPEKGAAGRSAVEKKQDAAERARLNEIIEANMAKAGRGAKIIEEEIGRIEEASGKVMEVAKEVNK